MESTNGIRKRPFVSRDSSQNLEHHLQDRESQWKRRRFNTTNEYFQREMIKCITPNLSVHNVDHPVGYIRKFTPNGRQLLCFSQDQRSLQIYDYNGVAKLGEMLQNVSAEVVSSRDNSPTSVHIRQGIYDKLFTLRRSIAVIGNDWNSTRSHLNREFSIFMEDGRYVLLGSIARSFMETIPIDYYYTYTDLNDDCEIFDYTLFVVDLQNECVADTFNIEHDSILLAHNHGVSVYGSTVALLSKCRQCIEILELRSGRLFRVATVGRSVLPNDGLGHLDRYEMRTTKLLSELKQKMLAHLYLEIQAIESAECRKLKIRQFYKNFGIYECMTMTKMQLFDTDKILLRYEHPNSDVTTELGGPQSIDEKFKFRLYVFYCMSTERVLRVFGRDSIELLYMLRNFCDSFRNVRSLQTRRQSSSPSNNAYFRAAFNSTIESIPGGETEAALRFNPTLPISCQSFTTSPYLDYDLFNYNDRLISALERPKISLIESIYFKDRETNAIRFRIRMDTKADDPSVCGTCRELVAFVFHPYEPFLISIQKLANRHIINFHVYNQATMVKQ